MANSKALRAERKEANELRKQNRANKMEEAKALMEEKRKNHLQELSDKKEQQKKHREQQQKKFAEQRLARQAREGKLASSHCNTFFLPNAFLPLPIVWIHQLTTSFSLLY